MEAKISMVLSLAWRCRSSIEPNGRSDRRRAAFYLDNNRSLVYLRVSPLLLHNLPSVPDYFTLPVSTLSRRDGNTAFCRQSGASKSSRGIHVGPSH
jgi:hypothetical protein